MKSFNMKKLITTIKYLTVVLMLMTSSVSFAGDGHGHHHRWNGWQKVALNDDGDNGNHYGHDNENGKHKGFENERNHWYSGDDSQQDAGVSVDLTVHDYALNPGTTFNATYNSLQTVQDVLTDLLGDTTSGYALQRCYETTDMLTGTTSNNCTSGETLDPLPLDSTLDAAGLVDDPEVYLVKQ